MTTTADLRSLDNAHVWHPFTPMLEQAREETPVIVAGEGFHLIDSDGSLNEHNTSTHNPFGTGKLNFDKLAPELMNCGVPNDWWCVDLCFWPNAWDVTADSKRFLDKLRAKYGVIAKENS